MIRERFWHSAPISARKLVRERAWPLASTDATPREIATVAYLRGLNDVRQALFENDQSAERDQ